MKKLIILGALAIAFLPSLASAQTCTGQSNCTAVSATITDANSISYSNCSWNVQFSNSPSPPQGQTYQFNYSPINPAYLAPQNGRCNASGAFTVNLPANTAILPAATHWIFNITAQDGVTTFSSTQTITGATQSLTTALSTASAAQPCSIIASPLWPSGYMLTGNCAGSGSGNVSNSGTPTANQLPLWVTATTIKGVTLSGDFTISGTGLGTNTGLNGTSLAGLATGLLKNTTTTGVPSTVTGTSSITGVQGNGANLQLSTGATTTNDCVKFDANGNTVDAGAACGSSVSSGTVTTFSAGNLSPLFTSSVANASTTPALTFTLSSFAADSLFMNATGGSAGPSAVAMPTCTTGADLYNTTTHTWSCVAAGGNVSTLGMVNGHLPVATGTNSLGDSGIDPSLIGTSQSTAGGTYCPTVTSGVCLAYGTITFGSGLSWNLGTGTLTATATSFTAAGDLSGNSSSQTVVGAHWTTRTVTTTPITVAATDYQIVCDATSNNVVLNLPAATGSGKEYNIKRVDATFTSGNSCTITPNGTDTIDGAATQSITQQYANQVLIDSVSGNWYKKQIIALVGDVGGASNSNTLAAKYKTGSCQTGIGDGVNLIAAASYLQSFCYNDSGVTRTITSVKCYTDAGVGTLTAIGNTLGSIVTAFNCGSTFPAAGSLVGTALTSTDYIKFTFAADGSSHQATWVVSYTQ